MGWRTRSEANHTDNYDAPGLSAQAGTDLLQERFGEFSGADARVVVHSDGHAIPATELAGLRDRLGALPGVAVVAPPRMSADGDTALIDGQLPHTGHRLLRIRRRSMLCERPRRPPKAPATRWNSADRYRRTSPRRRGVAEAIGIVAALVILVFAFGSVVAAGLPLAVALIGVGIGTALITVLAGFTDISTVAPTIATMVGIGVGIDYALLLVTRFTEGLRSGLSVRAAAGRANGTAGLSVVFAGTTVLVSLFGLCARRPAGVFVVRLRHVRDGRIGDAGVGDPGARAVRAGGSSHSGPPTEVRSRRVTRIRSRAALGGPDRATAVALGSSALCSCCCCSPRRCCSMRTWPQDAGSQPTSNTTRLAYDLIAAEFGPGANGPFVVAVDLKRVPESELAAMSSSLRRRSGCRRGVAAGRQRRRCRRDHLGAAHHGPAGRGDDSDCSSGCARSCHRTATSPASPRCFADISDRLAERLVAGHRVRGGAVASCC